MDIRALLTLMITQKASDLHLSAGMPPMIRVNGRLCPVEGPALADQEVKALVYEIMTELDRKDYELNLETDFSFELPRQARFRVNAFHQNLGAAASFRWIPDKVISLETLKTPDIFKKLCDLPRGLVLVTGPTGSGKSTTLAAMVDYINTHRQEHIITIEDPIEFVHQSKSCLINHREVNRDTKSFNQALRAALREDPDIILVGELRDLETIRMALTAAETGHLVLSTLHTSSAAKTINRIIDVFPGEEKEMVRGMLSESLKAVISQTLLPTIDQKSRIAAFEIMINNHAIGNLIREAKVPQMYSVMQTGSEFGMQTLDQCLQQLVRENKIDKNIAYTKAENKSLFQ